MKNEIQIDDSVEISIISYKNNIVEIKRKHLTSYKLQVLNLNQFLDGNKKSRKNKRKKYEI